MCAYRAETCLFVKKVYSEQTIMRLPNIMNLKIPELALVVFGLGVACRAEPQAPEGPCGVPLIYIEGELSTDEVDLAVAEINAQVAFYERVFPPLTCSTKEIHYLSEEWFEEVFHPEPGVSGMTVGGTSIWLNESTELLIHEFVHTHQFDLETDQEGCDSAEWELHHEMFWDLPYHEAPSGGWWSGWENAPENEAVTLYSMKDEWEHHAELLWKWFTQPRRFTNLKLVESRAFAEQVTPEPLEEVDDFSITVRESLLTLQSLEEANYFMWLNPRAEGLETVYLQRLGEYGREDNSFFIIREDKDGDQEFQIGEGLSYPRYWSFSSKDDIAYFLDRDNKDGGTCRGLCLNELNLGSGSIKSFDEIPFPPDSAATWTTRIYGNRVLLLPTALGSGTLLIYDPIDGRVEEQSIQLDGFATYTELDYSNVNALGHLAVATPEWVFLFDLESGEKINGPVNTLGTWCNNLVLDGTDRIVAHCKLVSEVDEPSMSILSGYMSDPYLHYLAYTPISEKDTELAWAVAMHMAIASSSGEIGLLQASTRGIGSSVVTLSAE